MLTPTPKEIVLQWVAAYNRHDPEAAVGLYADDVTNLQHPWAKPVKGREAMRATYINIFRAFPDICIEVENLLGEGSWAVAAWRFRGTMRGEFAGFSPTNRSLDLRGCEFFEVLEGKIHTQHGYWDKATLFDQLGLGTAPGDT